MALEIKWTPRALESYENIVKHLEKEWSDREIAHFVIAVEEKLNGIAIFPEMFVKTNAHKNIHRAIISKQTILFYRYRKIKRRVELVEFWDTRQNPKKLKY